MKPSLVFLVIFLLHCHMQGVLGLGECAGAKCSYTLDHDCGETDFKSNPDEAARRGCYFCTNNFRDDCSSKSDGIYVNTQCKFSDNLLVSCNSCIGESACWDADNSRVYPGACRCAFDAKNPDEKDYSCPIGSTGLYGTCESTTNSIMHNNSCIGKVACYRTNRMDIGVNACQGENVCKDIYSSADNDGIFWDKRVNGRLTIGNGACVSANACSMERYQETEWYENHPTYISIGADSCREVADGNTQDGEKACSLVNHTIIGNNSCRGFLACSQATDLVIEDNACRGISACESATDSVIHDYACTGPSSCVKMVRMDIDETACQGELACAYIYDPPCCDNDDVFWDKRVDGRLSIGKGACVRKNACAMDLKSYRKKIPTYISIGADSCREVGDNTTTDGHYACSHANYTIISEDACRGLHSCYQATDMIIEDHACRGISSCDRATDSVIRRYACTGTSSCAEMNRMDIGESACQGEKACAYIYDLPCCDNDNIFSRKRVDGRLTIGQGACVSKGACEMDYELFKNEMPTYISVGYDSCREVGDNTTEDGHYACSRVNEAIIGTNACRGQHACYQATDSVIGDNACRGISACDRVANVTIGSGSCQGNFSCSGLSNSEVATPASRRELAMREDAMEHDIPEDTCVGPGICKQCEYGLNFFAKRCHKDHSPGDVTEDGRCKLCKALGHDEFHVELREKVKDAEVNFNCDFIGRAVVDQVGGALVEQKVQGVDFRFGPIRIKVAKKKGHCSVVMSYSPNASEEPDHVVLENLKASVRTIVKSQLFLESIREEHPDMSSFIKSVTVLDGKNAQEMESSLSSGKSGKAEKGGGKSEKSTPNKSSTLAQSSKGSKSNKAAKKDEESSFFE